MLFSELIGVLQDGSSELQEHNLANDPKIINGASLDKAVSNQISFLEPGNALSIKLNESNAGAVILPPDQELIDKANKRNLAWVVVKNPRLVFAECLSILNPNNKPEEGIHKTASLGENVTIESGVYIGAHVSIGNDSYISKNSIIHPGVVLYQGVLIGEATELHANCVIHQDSKIGSQCVIHSNAVIGSEGFGFVPSPNGWKKMPQTGIVIIEDAVEVGCCSTIDRPAVGETRIGEGTKIDNLVQIGHGVTTGKGCAMAAQVGIAGGATLGDGVILAGQVGVGNRVKVGNRVTASSKCGIHTDIESNQVISGFPAMSNRLWLRCSANFRKLPEIAKSIKKLTREQ